MPLRQQSANDSLKNETAYLIAAGTSHYSYIEDADLASVNDDINLIVDCLTSNALGYTRVLPELGTDPTSTGLKEALGAWFGEPRRTPADRVVVYYSGHGETHQDRHYLLTSDSRLNRLASTAFPAEELVRIILDSPVQQVMIILDTCYAGQGIIDLTSLAGKVTCSRAWQAEIPFGFVFISAARAKDEASQGAFANAFTEAIRNPKGQFGGRTQEYLEAPSLIKYVNEIFDQRHPHQSAVWSVAPPLREFPRFLPNPRYDSSTPEGIDIESQRQRDLIDHWVPRARGAEVYGEVSYFTGREAALRELVQWLKATQSGGKAHVVTGGPGTGKSALLARLVTLSDPQYREPMENMGALKAVPEDTVPPQGVVDIAVHARQKSLDEVVRIIAAATGLKTNRVDELVEVLAKRNKRCTIVIDALDEAKERDEIAERLLRRLTGFPHLWLLIGTRPDTRPDHPGRCVQKLGGRTIEINLNDEKYLGREDIARYVMQRLLAVDEPARATPYRNRPQLARRVAEIVAAKAGKVFLIARIVVSTLTESDEPVDTDRYKFPDEVGEAFWVDLERFNSRKDIDLDRKKVMALLRPLAYAEGEGIPWENLWLPLANAIAGRGQSASGAYDNDDIGLLLDHVGAYVVEAREGGISVYRLYHEALAEYLRDEKRSKEIQTCIVNTLVGLVPMNSCNESRDWVSAPAYTRNYLSTHAAAASKLSGLIDLPLYLVAAEPNRLLRAIQLTHEQLPDAPTRVYQTGFHYMSTSAAAERASYLEMTARQLTENIFADGFAQLRLGQTWRVVWARWQHSVAHRVLKGNRGEVHAIVTATYNGRPVIISGGQDNTIRVWDLAAGTLVGEPLRGHLGDVFAVTVSVLDGRPVIISGGWDRTVRVWDLALGIPLRELWGHRGSVLAIAAGTLNGRSVIVSGSEDKTIQLWDLAAGTPIGEPLEGHDGSVYALAIGMLNGRSMIVSGGEDKTVRLWDLADGTSVGKPLEGHEGRVDAVAVAILNGSPVAISGSADKTVRLWDLVEGAPLGEPLKAQSGVNAITVGTLDGRPVIITGEGDKTVRVWDLAAGVPVGEPLEGHQGSVEAVAVSTLNDRPMIVSGSWDNTVRIWDLAVETPIGERSRHHQNIENIVNTVAVGTLDRRSVAITGDWDGIVRVWDLGAGTPIGDPFESDQRCVTLAAGTLNGRLVIVSGGWDSMQVWDVAGGKPLSQTFGGYHGGVNAVTVSLLDGRSVIVSGGEDSTVQVWDLGAGTPLGDPLRGHGGSVYAVTVGVLDGRSVIVSAGEDSAVRVWDLAAGAPLGKPLLGHRGSVYALTVSTLDGRPVIVSGGGDKTIRIWDLASGAPLGQPLKGHIGAVTAIVVVKLGDRRVIVSGGRDNTVRVWDGRVTTVIDCGSVVTDIEVGPNASLVVATWSGIMMCRYLFNI